MESFTGANEQRKSLFSICDVPADYECLTLLRTEVDKIITFSLSNEGSHAPALPPMPFSVQLHAPLSLSRMKMRGKQDEKC